MVIPRSRSRVYEFWRGAAAHAWGDRSTGMSRWERDDHLPIGDTSRSSWEGPEVWTAMRNGSHATASPSP
jgi:hypothetical protein